MTVNCEACKVQMVCVSKAQESALAITRSVYVCDHCHARVEIVRQGVRKEDHSVERMPITQGLAEVPDQ